jgi:hypothetical protein
MLVVKGTLSVALPNLVEIVHVELAHEGRVVAVLEIAR